MSTKGSTTPIIAWNWVIDALAKFEQVDTSTLVGLVKKAPAIPDDMGKDSMEKVSLRILESLFIHGNETTVDTDSAQNAKIHFDSSECCEDVLLQILHETSEPMTKSKRQKWDVQPFIVHKRSSLPASPLKKLKETILEGNHPLLASLKERNNLGVVPMVDGTFDTQTTVAKDDLVSMNAGNENNKLKESLLQTADQDQNSTGGTTEHTRREEYEMSTKPAVEGLDGNLVMDHDEDAASKKLGPSCDDVNTKHDQCLLPDDDDNVPQDKSSEGQDKRVSIDGMKEVELLGRLKHPKNNIHSNASISGPSNKVKNSMEHNGQLETDIDSERSDDERIDIAAKKESFLSSEGTFSQDTLAVADWSEINLCMKCNEGGHLLVCSSDACPLTVHESCLGSAASLDMSGKFFCPFCAYSHAISKYLESKRKVSLARKDLQAFFISGVNCRPKMSSTKRSGLEKDELRQSGALAETSKANSNADTVNRANIGPSCGEKGAAVNNAENPAVADPSRFCVDDELPRGKEVVSVVNQNVMEAQEGGQKVGEECQSPTKMEKQQPSSEAVSGSGLKSRTSNGNGRSLGTGEHVDIHLNNQLTTESPWKQISQPTKAKQKCKEKEHRSSIVSSYPKRRCTPKAQYTSPPVPSLRRRILPWTKSEEEILKEGVQRFSSVNNKGIPWTEILDFGREVFHKSRTTIDLKDKWRNVCKDK